MSKLIEKNLNFHTEKCSEKFDSFFAKANYLVSLTKVSELFLDKSANLFCAKVLNYRQPITAGLGIHFIVDRDAPVVRTSQIPSVVVFRNYHGAGDLEGTALRSTTLNLTGATRDHGNV